MPAKFDPQDVFFAASEKMRLKTMQDIQDNISKIIIKQVKLTTALIRIAEIAQKNNLIDIQDICNEVIKK